MSLVNIIQEHIVLQPSSGLTIKAYCHQHSINKPVLSLSEARLSTLLMKSSISDVVNKKIILIAIELRLKCKIGLTLPCQRH
jgi:hypothetical protein